MKCTDDKGIIIYYYARMVCDLESYLEVFILLALPFQVKRLAVLGGGVKIILTKNRGASSRCNRTAIRME